VIKRGEYGFAMYTKEEGYFILPAMPIPTVIDPTGAGDTFAGGFFGYLAAQKEVPTVDHMKQACIMGSMMASHTIQDFSIRSLAKVTHDALESRLTQYKKVITV
jgi:sugar/nucleoside kinase (ribokinase family)